MYTRRQFGKVALAGLASYRAVGQRNGAQSGGLSIGLQTYSLRSVPYDGAVDAIIQAMQRAGLWECELFSAQIEPAPDGYAGGGARGPGGAPSKAEQRAAADALSKWRMTVPLDYFAGIRKKFNSAGIDIVAYNARFTGSDEEVDRTFAMAKALGAEVVAARVPLPMTQRVASFAEKNKMKVAIQSTDAGTLAQQLPMSSYFGIDLDIGDFTRAGHDALQYVRDQCASLIDIHLKDCKLNGPSVPFGEGDSHMKEILQFLKQKAPSVRAFIDCDYPGTGASVEEIEKCYAYVKAALA
jgi:sugar phosphate isomerase/epimerase